MILSLSLVSSMALRTMRGLRPGMKTRARGEEKRRLSAGAGTGEISQSAPRSAGVSRESPLWSCAKRRKMIRLASGDQVGKPSAVSPMVSG